MEGAGLLPAPQIKARVVFWRHGQGYHNVEDAFHLHDPSLTPLGQQEAEAIRKWYTTPTDPSASTQKHYPPPQVIFVSPLERTLETATIGFREHVGSTTMIATDLCREVINHNPCNYRRTISTKVEKFSHINFQLCTEDGPPDASESFPVVKQQVAALRPRCRRFFDLLQQVVVSSAVELEEKRIEITTPEKQVTEIAVVCHQSFLRAMLAELLGIAPHFSVSGVKTASCVEICLMSETFVEKDRNHAKEHLFWTLAAHESVHVSPMPHIVLTKGKD